ncbi:MAG: glycosyltransferase family 2 protein [Ignavibacteria bacterium]|nr:glycosyltransferase family 2 protein [Ignavibacteria bacterium]
MKVSGFSIARNAIHYGYPVVEAITSVLPLCDEFIVNVGTGDDGTLELVRSIASPKISIIEREWDMSLREGGQLISVETNHALAACSGDWCVYIQADEVLHERYLPVVRRSMEQFLGDPDAEALQFRYKHFYGSYDYYQDNNRRWYTKESRVIRRSSDIVSWGDGMDFRHRDGSRLSFRRIPAEIYHYGWVRPPKTMVRKQEAFRKLYYSDQELAGDDLPENMYTDLGNLCRFTETHPAVMLDRVSRDNWDFDARLDEQHPDWLRHILLFLQPLTKRIRRLTDMVLHRRTQTGGA